MALYRVNLVGWFPWDPTGVDIDRLAYEMTYGDAICNHIESDLVRSPTEHPEWPEIESFFDEGDDDEF